MGKSKKHRAAKCSHEEIRDRYLAMINTGEKLGSELIDQLSDYGASFEGLVIETYAISKAWGALLAIAEEKGFEAETLLKSLVPSFKEEMTESLKDICSEDYS